MWCAFPCVVIVRHQTAESGASSPGTLRTNCTKVLEENQESKPRNDRVMGRRVSGGELHRHQGEKGVKREEDGGVGVCRRTVCSVTVQMPQIQLEKGLEGAEMSPREAVSLRQSPAGEQKERWPCNSVVIETQAAPRSTHTNDPACRVTACQAAPDPSRITIE
ncbi:hypothetical protein KUCAC02_034027 [Chaenocephalus aceratus]|nr:hypothetical protein KUCAC02_034027 [Chaenocephalus aceratus]